MSLAKLRAMAQQVACGTALIVAQIAIVVAVLPFAAHDAEETITVATQDDGYPAEELLEASLAMEPAAGSDSSAASQQLLDQRFRARAAELIRRCTTAMPSCSWWWP